MFSNLWYFSFQTTVTPSSLAMFAKPGVLTVTLVDNQQDGIAPIPYHVTHFFATQTSFLKTRDDRKYCLKSDGRVETACLLWSPCTYDLAGPLENLGPRGKGKVGMNLFIYLHFTSQSKRVHHYRYRFPISSKLRWRSGPC